MYRLIWILCIAALVGCKSNDGIGTKSGIIKLDYSQENELRSPKHGESLIILEQKQDHFIRLKRVNQQNISAIYVLATNGLFVHANSYTLEVTLYDKKDFFNMKVLGNFTLNHTFQSGQTYKLKFDSSKEEKKVQLFDSTGAILDTLVLNS